MDRVNQMKVSHPLDPEARLGAVVSKMHFDKVMGCIELARQEGGQILTGGHALSMPSPYDKGWYIAPTIIEGLTEECRTNQEEIFGPVVTIQSFDTDEEALALANCTNYGLSATVWTNNLERANYFSRNLQAGIVWVNTWMLRDLRTPFGGVKHSGVGREGGWEAMRFFTETKNVTFGL